MPVVSCPHCSNQAQVDESFLSQQLVTCPHCKKVFGVSDKSQSNLLAKTIIEPQSFDVELVPVGPTDPDLARIIDAWPALPEHIKRAILALLESGARQES